MAASERNFSAKPVLRLHRPTLEEFDAHRRVPVVITGGLDDWDLYKSLRDAATLDDKLAYLRRLVGWRPVSFNVIKKEHRGHMYFAEGLATRVNYELGFWSDFAERLAKSHGDPNADIVYMHSNSIARFPKFFDAIKPIPFVSDKKVSACGAWIGSGGNIVDLHHDYYANVMCMVNGRKRVIMLPAGHFADVYCRPLDRSPANTPASAAKILDLRPGTFPRLQTFLDRESRCVELEAGEILYIPANWWHHVESHGFNVMINRWSHWLEPEQLDSLLALRRTGFGLYGNAPAGVRSKLADAYARHVFATNSGDNPSWEGIAPAGTREKLEEHATTLSALCRAMPEESVAYEKDFYDHWIFQQNGDPLPFLPGEHARMVGRMAVEPPKPSLTLGKKIAGWWGQKRAAAQKAALDKRTRVVSKA